MPRVASGEFVVGVETEAPLQVWSMKKTKQKDNRGRHIMERDRLLAGNEALAEVARQFNNAGLRAYADAVDANRDHSKWGITIDSSIEVGTELQGVGSPIEIKSPPLGLVSSHYKQIIETMWKIIGPMKVEIIQAWLMSNTQFHFSVKGCHNFPQGPAQKLGMCIIFFEKAIDDMIPSNPYKGDGRRPGGWKHCDRYTKRNRVVPDPEQGLPVDDLRSCWHYIRKTKNIRALSTLICFDEDKYRRDNDFEIKNWKWNFKGLGYKTIEFRHMPPTLSAQQTLDWITFTTEFVSAAVSIDEDRLDQAMSGECSFREALGLGMNGKSREEWLQLEEVWASDEGAGVMTYKSLQKFMTKNSHAKESLFTRLVETRDWWETQLAAL